MTIKINAYFLAGILFIFFLESLRIPMPLGSFKLKYILIFTPLFFFNKIKSGDVYFSTFILCAFFLVWSLPNIFFSKVIEQHIFFSIKLFIQVALGSIFLIYIYPKQSVKTWNKGVMIFSFFILFWFVLAMMLYSLNEIYEIQTNLLAYSRKGLVNNFLSVVSFDGIQVRYQGLFVEPNHWGGALNFLLLLTIYKNMKAKPIHSSYYFSIIIICLQIILSGSRASVVVMFFLLTVFEWKRLFIFVFFGASSFLLAISSYDKLFNLVVYRLTNIKSTPTSIDRIDIWIQYISSIIHPGHDFLFGRGLTENIGKQFGIEKDSHNIFIDIAGWFGFFGLFFFSVIVFFLPFILFFTKIKMYKNSFYFIVAGIFLISTLGMTQNILFYPYFWSIVFFILVVSRRKKAL